MKTLYILTPMALLAFCAGCQSSRPSSKSQVSTSTQTAQLQQNAPPAVLPEALSAAPIRQFTTGNVTYTIESIPNTRLTPTSREGDRSGAVYSSNIIAVYVHTNNSVTIGGTNATLIPTPANIAHPNQ